MYLTDIMPGTASNEALDFILTATFPGRPDKYTQFVAVDVTGLRNIQRPDPARPEVYVYRTATPLPLANRLVAFGPNPPYLGPR